MPVTPGNLKLMVCCVLFMILTTTIRGNNYYYLVLFSEIRWHYRALANQNSLCSTGRFLNFQPFCLGLQDAGLTCVLHPGESLYQKPAL